MNSVKYSSTGRFIDLVKKNAESNEYKNITAVSINPSGEYFNISFEQMYNVSCQAASYFQNFLINTNFNTSRNVGLLSYSNSHYLFNLLGLMSVNLAPVILSPRNSLEGVIMLLKQSDSRVIIYQEGFEDWIDEIKLKIPNLVLVPMWKAEYPKCLSPANYTPLIPLKSQEEELNATGYFLHSSGSTSFPKLVSKTNRNIHNNGYRIGIQDGESLSRELIFFPLFHSAGLQALNIPTIYLKRHGILSPDMPPGSLFSSKMILKYIKELLPRAVSILPLMVKELFEYCDSVNESEGWDILRGLDILKFAGAQLPQSLIQKFFSKGIKPFSNFGSTECGSLFKSLPNKNITEFIPLTPVKGLNYKLKEWGDGLSEMVILNGDDCLSWDKDRDEEGNYPTKDLFKIIGENPIQLQYISRIDDTIIHVNGEKTNPIPIEDKINLCQYVDRCAILGCGRQFNTLLIQLDLNEVLSTSLHDVVSSIKSFVKSANESAPSHSRIYEEMIYYLPINSEKKLPVTMKGNLQRSKCAKLFEEEIKQFVENIESGYASEELRELQSNSSVESGSTESIVKSCLGIIVSKSIGNKDSFFNNGMDSLSGMRFRNLLKSKIPDLDLKVTDIYDNDTVEKLAEFIEYLKQGNKPNAKSLEAYQKEVDDYITRYSDLRLEKPSNKKLPTEDFHIAITGANGSLGSFMIKNLVEQSKVSKVYALIRAKDDTQAKQKLESSFSQRFINIDPENSSKVVPLAVNLHEDQLGLTKETYESILNKLTHVHHVGWTMNFLKGLDYFDDCIAASKNLMKLSVLSKHKVIYNLVSTIGATFPTTSADVTSVPECKLNTKLVNPTTCNGYNLSKLVTETVSQVWSKDYDVPIHIHRVGQISGDTINGAWNITEHFPLLVKGIQVMKICPDILESSVAWVPVNTAADAIVEIGAQDQTNQNTFAHIINPLEYDWKIIYNALKSFGIEFEAVPVKEFIHQLKTNQEFQNADVNPLATLTDFFDNVFLSRSGFGLETELTKKSSPSIANCPALDSDLMMKYLKFWTDQKFIQ